MTPFANIRLHRVACLLLLVLLARPLPAPANFLTFVEAQKNSLGGVSGLGGAISVVVSPDGQQLYAAGFVDDAVAVFRRNPATSALTFVEAQRDGVGGVHGIAGPTSVALSPDGKDLYVASGDDNAVAVFAREPSAGTLTFLQVVADGVGGVSNLMTPHAVTVSSDGHHVYAAAFSSDALVVFERDPSSGLLTFVEAVQFTVGIIEGLRGASDVAVSPDGAHVYATGQTDNAIAEFSRDPASGRLTFIDVQRDGINGVDGLAAAVSLTVSPDGQQVYATGFNAEAVAVFQRDSSTGQLTFVEVQRNLVQGVSGLLEPLDVAVSDDGTHVYVASNGSNALVVFARDADSGGLSFVEADIEGAGSIDGLTGASGVAVSPDGNSVYVAGSEDNAVAAFSGALPPTTPTVTATPSPTGTLALMPTPTLVATLTPELGVPPTATATHTSSSGGGGGCAVVSPTRKGGEHAIALLVPFLLLGWRPRCRSWH